MRHFLEHTTRQVGWRSFLLDTVATSLAAALGRPRSSAADLGTKPLWKPDLAPLPAPKPIPDGLDLTSTIIHVLLPGLETITLPFRQLTLQGLHVEPSTITDFKGVTVLAYHASTVTGSDGLT